MLRRPRPSGKDAFVDLLSPLGDHVPAELGFHPSVSSFSQHSHLLRVMEEAVYAPCYGLRLNVSLQSILEVLYDANSFSCHYGLAGVPGLQYDHAKGLVPA